MDAIVFTSNTGYTAQYAELLLHGGSRVSEEKLRPVLGWCGQ